MRRDQVMQAYLNARPNGQQRWLCSVKEQGRMPRRPGPAVRHTGRLMPQPLAAAHQDMHVAHASQHVGVVAWGAIGQHHTVSFPAITPRGMPFWVKCTEVIRRWLPTVSVPHHTSPRQPSPFHPAPCCCAALACRASLEGASTLGTPAHMRGSVLTRIC